MPIISLTQLMIHERLLCEKFTISRDLNTKKHTADTIPQNKIFAKTSKMYNLNYSVKQKRSNYGNIWPRPETVSIRMSQWSCNRV